MKLARIRLLIIIAVSLIVIGGTGAAITYYTGLNAFFASQQYEDYQRLNQIFENASRYTISEQAAVTTPVTLRIKATGGTITVRESISNQVEVDFRMPYQPSEKTVPLLQRNGDTFTVDTAIIWRELTGRESQPTFNIDVRVPAGTSLDISNTVGDVELNGQLNAVKVSQNLGSVELRTPDINSLDATLKIGGNIEGDAPKSSTINVNVGSVDLHVSQPGTHAITASTGDIDVSVDTLLTVAATYQITTGEFNSQVANTSKEVADVIIDLVVITGDIEISPR
jgi:hypothetical protein